MGKERIKYIAALLLSLTVWYQCCTTLFSHTHTIGRYRITHSHPYTGTSDNPCHSHTAAQFLTIALLSAFTALAAHAGRSGGRRSGNGQAATPPPSLRHHGPAYSGGIAPRPSGIGLTSEPFLIKILRSAWPHAERTTDTIYKRNT